MTSPDVDPAVTSPILCSAWATPADVPERYRPDLSDEGWARLLMLSSEILWALSGRRWYGRGCTETVTLRALPRAGDATWPYHPSWGSCGCVDMARSSYYARRGDHQQPFAIQLPRRPRSITTVTVDGVAFTDFRLTASGWLERLDGHGWQMCGETTVITYAVGEAPPVSGSQAAVDLAVQMHLDRVGDSSCLLPIRMQSFSRQGISVEVLDTMEFLDNGRTGLYSVDLFLAAINPKGRGQRATVWSPDTPRAVRG